MRHPMCWLLLVLCVGWCGVGCEQLPPPERPQPPAPVAVAEESAPQEPEPEPEPEVQPEPPPAAPVVAQPAPDPAAGTVQIVLSSPQVRVIKGRRGVYFQTAYAFEPRHDRITNVDFLWELMDRAGNVAAVGVLLKREGGRLDYAFQSAQISGGPFQSRIRYRLHESPEWQDATDWMEFEKE